MPTDPPDLATQLALLGFRAGRDALAAFLTHAHQSSRVTISRPGRPIEHRGVERRIVSHPA